MRQVTGPTDHVVVVGAGLGGLSAALHLAGAGRQVTVLERDSVPGGRAGLIADQGYSFDTGPTVLTMPEVIAETFAAVGEELTDWLDLKPVTPLYRGWFADGTSLDVLADQDEMAESITALCGAREADGFRRYVEFVTSLYRYEMNDFIDRNYDSVLDVFTPSLARLAALGAFRRMEPKVRQYLRDPRLQRLFSFQSMYAGLSPMDALALYCVISYMDCVAGVYAPVGGVHALPRSLAAAAEKHGVSIRYDDAVERVELVGERAVAVRTVSGDRIACDTVVLNPDLPTSWRDLLGLDPATHARLRYSPSCFVMLAGSSTTYSRTAHHNIHFGRSWTGVFRDLFEKEQLMQDPSFLVSRPTTTDPSLAPDGRQIYYVFFPTPNAQAAVDWSASTDAYRDSVVETLERRGYIGFADGVEVEHLTTPSDWASQGMAAGTPFAAAHTFWQTGPFRPRNIWGENVVFTGSGTTPGVGVPMVLLSGRLAAERVVGPSTRPIARRRFT